MSRHKHVTHMNDNPWSQQSNGQRLSWRRKALARATSGQKLGCSVYELDPGKASFPLHFHHANEEAIFVLEGAGTIQIGSEFIPVRSGDYISLPIGSANAHQMINTSEEILRYLCISTMIEPDITEYPNTGKIGVFSGSAPGGDPTTRRLSRILDGKAERTYFEGEE